MPNRRDVDRPPPVIEARESRGMVRPNTTLDCSGNGARGIARSRECEEIRRKECEEAGAKGIYRTGCNDCNDAAAKGIVRVDCSGVPPVEEPNGLSPAAIPVLLGLNACLEQSGLTYYSWPAAELATGGRVAYNAQTQTVHYNADFLEGRAPYDRAFWLAGALAAHVLTLEEKQFGRRRPAAQKQQIRDYLTGYLTRCLVARELLAEPVNLSRNDPRVLFARYLANGGFSVPGDPRRVNNNIEDWQEGWRNYGMGIHFSLRHDPTMRTPADDPYR